LLHHPCARLGRLTGSGEDIAHRDHDLAVEPCVVGGDEVDDASAEDA
jgi:hypothetical protein